MGALRASVTAAAEAQGDEIVSGRRRRRGGRELVSGGRLVLDLDGVLEVRLERLVVPDDVGEQRLEALVLLPHLAHLRLGRLQLVVLHMHNNQEKSLDDVLVILRK